MENAQAKAKTCRDAKAKIGDKVLLWQEKVLQGLSPKLYQKWNGPYCVTEVGPHYTYALKNMETNKVVKGYVNASRIKIYSNRGTVIDEHNSNELMNNSQNQS